MKKPAKLDAEQLGILIELVEKEHNYGDLADYQGRDLKEIETILRGKLNYLDNK